MSILGETHTSEDQREHLENERNHSTFAFWGLGDLTQKRLFPTPSIYLKIFMCLFFNDQTRFRCANVQHFHHPFIDWCTHT